MSHLSCEVLALEFWNFKAKIYPLNSQVYRLNFGFVFLISFIIV